MRRVNRNAGFHEPTNSPTMTTREWLESSPKQTMMDQEELCSQISGNVDRCLAGIYCAGDPGDFAFVVNLQPIQSFC